MSVPTPQAKSIHYRYAQEILDDAEANGVVLESDDDFKAYREQFVETHFNDPSSPRFMLHLGGVGVRAMMNGNMMTYWKAGREGRNALMEEEAERLRVLSQRSREADQRWAKVMDEYQRMREQFVDELLRENALDDLTNEIVYEKAWAFWCESDRGKKVGDEVHRKPSFSFRAGFAKPAFNLLNERVMEMMG